MNVEDAGGNRQALALAPKGDQSVWLVIGSGVTCRLVLAQLAGTPGLDISMTQEHVDRTVLTVTVTHLLATESFVDFRGLEARL